MSWDGIATIGLAVVTVVVGFGIKLSSMVAAMQATLKSINDRVTRIENKFFND